MILLLDYAPGLLKNFMAGVIAAETLKVFLQRTNYFQTSACIGLQKRFILLYGSIMRTAKRLCISQKMISYMCRLELQDFIRRNHFRHESLLNEVIIFNTGQIF